MHYIFDLALIAIITIAVLIARKRGFLNSSYTILSLIITIILIATLQQPFTDYLTTSQLGLTIREKVSEQVIGAARDDMEAIDNQEDGETAVKVGEMLGLPQFLMNFLDEKLDKQLQAVETMKNDTLHILTDTLTVSILKIVSIVLLFVMVRLGVFLLLKLLNLLFKLPVLSTVNSVLGMAVGALNGLLTVYILCAILTLLTPSEGLSVIGDIVDKTLIVKYFYNNNLLIEMFI